MPLQEVREGREVTEEEMNRALLLERFGPLQTLAKERPVDPYADQRRRRRVLLGDDAESSYPQAVDL